MIPIANNINYINGRFFIDIATSGCGSACTYCYISNPGKKQILIDETDFEQSLKCVINNSNFITGKQGSIISLCPNTEPFKSKESAKYVISVLSNFLPLGNPIQISTKEVIPIEVLEYAQNNCIFEKQFFIHISTSCITKAHIIEPCASPINVRFNNFNIIKQFKKLTSCIYIKPFTNNTANDLEKYIDLINKYRPDVACVGIDFKKTTILEKPCDLLYHSKKTVSKALDKNVQSKITYFRNEIEKRTEIPIFHSSTCIISSFNGMKTNSNIKIVAPGLCVQCNDICY